MLDAFKIKAFDLAPIFEEWQEGPVFKGNPKKDPPVEEWLESIRSGCVLRNVPEEYWYKVGQHYMGPKAKGRFDEVKKVLATVNGGKYRWTWKKFKVAMTNMGWDIDPDATETIKVRGQGSGTWFSRRSTERRNSTAAVSSPTSSSSSSITEAPKRTPPSRSNSILSWTKKPMVEEPIEDLEEEPIVITRPKPSRSRTLHESSFWPMRRDTKENKDIESAPNGDDSEPVRPKNRKARSDSVVATRPRSASRAAEISKPQPPTPEEHGKEVSTVTNAPVWLLNAVGAIDFLTSEHPKAMSVLSAILITAGSIPAIPAISAGAGGAILASGAAHAIGAIAVGLGQALGSSVKNSQSQPNESGAHH